MLVPIASAGAAPLSSILQSAGDWNAVQSAARRQADNDQPAYLSAPATTPFHETFEGQWTAPSVASKLAIFSDDGCDVWIDGRKVVARKDQGQALPDLANSLVPINFDFNEGQTYTIKVEYSNTVYLGSADIDGVTLFAYNDAVRTWAPSDAGGGGMGRNRRPDGSWFDDGRLTAPFDTHGGQSQSVKCGPGGRLNFAAETASDWDAWTDRTRSGAFVRSGYWQDEVVRATWKCDGGKFVVANAEGHETLVDSVEGQSATWVAWGTTGTRKVWIEFEDEGSTPPSGDGGARKDAVLKREQMVDVVSAQLLVRRKGSGNDYATTARVAAGGKDSDEQKAEVLVKLPDDARDAPVGTVLLDATQARRYEDTDATLSMTSASEGVYRSSDRIGRELTLRINAGNGSPEAKIGQTWDEVTEWAPDLYFDFGQASTISFRPAIAHEWPRHPDQPIRNQVIDFDLTKIKVLLWSRETNDYALYTFTPETPNWSRVRRLVNFSSTSISSDGFYNASLTVQEDKQRLIEEVEFQAVGKSVYEAQ